MSCAVASRRKGLQGGRFSVIFRLFLKDNLSGLRKKKQAKAYKNHTHFKYCQFLDVRIKPYWVSEFNSFKKWAAKAFILLLLPAVPNFGKLCDFSPKIFNIQKSHVVWLVFCTELQQLHTTYCASAGKYLIVESYWIQLPRHWGKEIFIRASSNVQS